MVWACEIVRKNMLHLQCTRNGNCGREKKKSGDGMGMPSLADDDARN